MAPDLPKLQVSKRLWQSCQQGALLRRHPHHQERPWQPLLRRQQQVPGHSDRELWRRGLHHYPSHSGNLKHQRLPPSWHQLLSERLSSSQEWMKICTMGELNHTTELHWTGGTLKCKSYSTKGFIDPLTIVWVVLVSKLQIRAKYVCRTETQFRGCMCLEQKWFPTSVWSKA